MKSAHFKIQQNGIIRYQSVKVHLEETAIFSEQFGAKIKMPKTGKLLGILHDGGKFSNAYQDYLKACREYELGNLAAPPRRGSVDHGIFGAIYVMEELRDKNEVFSELTAEILAMVIASHHGGLRDYLGLDASTPLWNRIEHYYSNKKEEYKSTKEEFHKQFSVDEIRQLFFHSVLEIKNLKSYMPKFTKFQINLVVKFLYSCLIDADRENTRLFMEGEQSKKENRNWAEYEKRLESFLGKLHQEVLEKPSERKMKTLREEISDACYEAGDWPTGVYKLTVPTGGGKTLASMRMALRHMQNKEAGNKGHIIEVLPFTSIIEQNAAVIRTVLECKEELLEHHSNVILETQEEDNNLSGKQYQLLTERWDSPFIFTTTVQFLDTVYRNGTQNIRRMHNLANSVIIMDEVQALPLKTMKLFGELVSFLCHVGDTTILLCTATQPNLEKLPIGINTEVKEIVPDVMKKFHQFQRMEVKDCILEGGYRIEEAAEFIEKVKEKVNSLLVVMNTRKITREIYEILRKRIKKETEVLYITNNLCPVHRSNVITYLKRLLKEKKSVICVSTSILEAGVDISFEGVVRNLAGLDSIVQSSGRGNRHGEQEKAGITYLINVKGEQLGSLTEIEIGEEKTKSVLDTYRRRPEDYGNSLLSPIALSDYYQKYFGAGDIEGQMKYPLKDDPELKDLYSYFTSTGEKILLGRYHNKIGDYKWNLTFPFETAAKKFQVIDQDTLSILVPYGKGKGLIRQVIDRKGKYHLNEFKSFIREARPYFVSLYTNKISVYQQALIDSPMSGILVLKEGYYDDILGIKTES